MSEVKRYGHQRYNGKIWFEERDDGKFCSYDDYVTLKAERDALAAENVALKEFGDTLNDMHNNLNGEGTGIQGCAEVACQQVALESALEEFDAIKTPVTAAYLNTVRADVIKQLHSEQKEWALVTWQYDSFDALKRAAVRHGDSELSGIIFMLDRIEGFAAKLRTGEPS